MVPKHYEFDLIGVILEGLSPSTDPRPGKSDLGIALAQ